MNKHLMIALALSIGSTAAADDAKKAPDTKKAPDPAPAKMDAPKPPKEVEDMAKGMAGTWNCTGKGIVDPKDTTKTADVKGTMTAKLDMDKWFVRGDWSGKMMGMTNKGSMFTTYNATSKKWTRLMIDNMGTTEMATSSGMQGTKMVWEGEMNGSMMPSAIKTRSTEEIGAKEVKISSEASMDGGKKYVQVFEMTCKK